MTIQFIDDATKQPIPAGPYYELRLINGHVALHFQRWEDLRNYLNEFITEPLDDATITIEKNVASRQVTATNYKL